MGYYFLRLGWDLNPRMAVLQTAALDHFATKPQVIRMSGIEHLNFNLSY